MLIAALLVVPVIAIEESGATGAWRSAAVVLNWVIWVAFLAELLVMLAVVEDRVAWLRRHPLDVAIVVLTPPILPGGIQALRVLRLLRILRLLRAVQAARRLFTMNGLRYGAVLALMTVFVGGAAFSAAEGPEVSAWDGVWWAMTTMTTVGYGDISPQSDLGRGIAIVVMVVGIGFLSLLIGAVAERFVAGDVREQVTDTEHVLVGEIDASETEIRAELRAIAQRLRELERRLTPRE